MIKTTSTLRKALASRRLSLPPEFLRDLEASGRSPRTKSAYVSDLNDFLKWLGSET